MALRSYISTTDAQMTNKRNEPVESTRDCPEVDEPLLCEHCLRTASNGVRCLGMCVADNEY